MIWVGCLRRASRAASIELEQFRAGLRSSRPDSTPPIAEIRAATDSIVGARVDLENAGAQLGQTLDSWAESLQITMEEVKASRRVRSELAAATENSSSLITAAGPRGDQHESARFAFAMDPLAFPNRSPNLSGLHRDASDTLGLRPDQPVTFVVPTLWVPPNDTTSSRWAVVTEDVLGVRAVDERLRRRWPEAKVRTRITDGQDERPPDVGNICSFCRDVRNPVTSALLHHEQTRGLFGFELGFWPITRKDDMAPLEWGVLFPDGSLRTSPSYGQGRELEAAGDGGIRVKGTAVLDDLALLARFPNPYGEGTVLIVAGIRALGTWGAAEYLRTHSDELHEKTNGGSFVSFVRVRGTYRVHPTEADGSVEFLLVASADRPTEIVEELGFRLIAA